MNRKSKSFISFALAVSLLSASSLSLSATAMGGNVVNPTGLTDNTTAKADAALKQSSGKQLKVNYNSSGNAKRIEGVLSSSAVTSANGAKSIIKSYASTLGIKNVDTELRYDSVNNGMYNRVYSFKQYYNNLEVYGAGVSVVVDKASNQADYLTSAYVPGLTLKTTAAVTKAKVISTVKSRYGAGVLGTPVLMVCHATEKNTLVWKVETDCADISWVFLDAQNGKTVYAETAKAADTSFTNSTTNSVLNARPRSITIFLTATSYDYTLFDRTRNIQIQNASGVNPRKLWDGWQDCRYTNLSDLRKTTSDLAVAASYQAAQAHDFFKDNLSWNGFDGAGGKTYVATTSVIDDARSKRRGEYGMMVFGEYNGKSLVSDLGIVTHEYAHNVTLSKTGWIYNDGLSGAIQEAYSDIFGEISESNTDWKSGSKVCAAGECLRNITNPSATGNPAEYLGANWLYTSNQTDDIPHRNSTVISHAAYLMETFGIPKYTIAKIFFASYDYYTPTSTPNFYDCRDAVVAAASKVFAKKENKAELVNKVRTAFNAVEIRKSNEVKGDINQSGQTDITDMTKLSQFMLGDIDFTAEQLYRADLNSDNKVSIIDMILMKNIIMHG